MSGPKPLTGTCAGCGAENSIYHPGWSDYYCHTCAQGMHNYELAREHLVDLVDPVLDVWRTHWLASGVTHKDLVEAVKGLEKQQQNDGEGVWQGHWLRDVQGRKAYDYRDNC